MDAQLLAEGVPALHFYSLNRAKATRELVDHLGIAATAAARAARRRTMIMGS